MTSKTNYILKNGRVIDPIRKTDKITDIGVMNGIITAPEKIKNPKIIDVSGLVVAPGFIDMHVHLRQPGKTAAETIASGTMAAAAGGFTAIVAMPNTTPPADTSAAIEYLKRHTERDGKVKVHPCGCMTKNQEGKEMSGIGSLKNAGVIAISDDGKCVQNHELMRHIAEYAASFGLPLLDHCEDASLAEGGVMNEGKWSTLLGMRGISPAAEELIVARDIILARMTGCHIHIQHISVSESIALVRNARKNKLPVSAEATPHHLTFTDETIKHFDTNYKMNPPLRAEADRLAVIEGLRDGTITAIATDHAPHTGTDKLVEFDYAPFGIIGLETAVPVCLTKLYHTGILGLSDLIAKFTTGPAEIIGLDAGTLREGAAADITLLDVDYKYQINAKKFYSKSRNTPFDGMSVKGKAVAAIVDGKFAYNERGLK